MNDVIIHKYINVLRYTSNFSNEFAKELVTFCFL